MEYEHPLYTPSSVAAQGRLPEIDSDRVTFAGAYHGWGFHEDGARPASLPRPGSGSRGQLLPASRLRRSSPASSGPRSATPGAPPSSGPSSTSRTCGWSISTTCPTAACWPASRARDHLGSPSTTIRGNVEAFLAQHDVDPAGGRILMAANPRSLGYCFNPISVFWCFDASGAQVAAVVEVHNTYGDRHAYLVHPDEQGRAGTAKAMYVSPFHGVDGHYELAIPRPTDRLDIAVTLHTADGQPFSAGVTGERVTTSGKRAGFGAGWRSAGAALRGSALIRVHGIWLWARRLPVRPRPTHHPGKVFDDEPGQQPSPQHHPGHHDGHRGARRSPDARPRARVQGSAHHRLGRDRAPTVLPLRSAAWTCWSRRPPTAGASVAPSVAVARAWSSTARRSSTPASGATGSSASARPTSPAPGTPTTRPAS
ncbi:DUF1365 domain-containing protein [Nocardioides sp. B-3]|uniref:DUF1365 domain-containing protein n=1 Tax=Nocardioides sp. B-3 TaxID=2895565 RepID=UPI0021525DEB|nr:FAD-dependent oxidoreductase [Nocardioides sp. B-3]UUZ61272.1 DUF1365 family protein [Nocardioides sp. B-3]